MLTLLKLLSVVLVLVGPAVLAAWRFGVGRAFGALGITLILTGAAGLASPHWDTLYVKVGLATALALWAAWIAFLPSSWNAAMTVLFDHWLTSSLMVLLISTVLPFGNLEWAARFATNLGLVEYHEPMTTRLMYNNEDWREHHVVSDVMRVQDPVLFWRPKPGLDPYNAQGFKNPFDVAAPKPDNVFRIMAYGDSNTDGSRSLDWPNTLHKLLQARGTAQQRYEVVNAGVAGYSSYQGLQRFLRERPVYEPDLVLVSFGWNDVADATDLPDKAYKPKSEAAVDLVRTLIKYRLYLVIQHYLLAARLQDEKLHTEPRVSLDDYRDNLRQFVAEGEAHGVPVVLLTRPHEPTVDKLRQRPGWRAQVPDYNVALLALAQQDGVQAIDVQGHFEHEVPDKSVFSDESHFYTEPGMAEMGRFMLQELNRRGLLPPPPESVR